MGAPNWVAALEPRAPDVVAVWNAIDDEGPTIRGIAFRREIRHRAGPGSAAGILAQHEAIADALASVLTEMPEPLLRAPGGEGDWNVAQAFAHTTGSRRWLAHAAALAARDEWPSEAPQVVPGVPGPADAAVPTLLTLLTKSRRSLAISADAIAGICNRERNVLGLMPHPERASEALLGSNDGRIIFYSLADTLAELAKAS